MPTQVGVGDASSDWTPSTVVRDLSSAAWPSPIVGCSAVTPFPASAITASFPDVAEEIWFELPIMTDSERRVVNAVSARSRRWLGRSPVSWKRGSVGSELGPCKLVGFTRRTVIPRMTHLQRKKGKTCYAGLILISDLLDKVSFA